MVAAVNFFAFAGFFLLQPGFFSMPSLIPPKAICLADEKRLIPQISTVM